MLEVLISLGWGTFSLTREKAESIVESLVKRGEIKREDARKTLKALLERGEKEKAEFKEHINSEVSRILQKSNLVAKSEFSELEKRVSALEAMMQEKEQEEEQEG